MKAWVDETQARAGRDAGLAAYLVGVDETRLTRNAALLGALLEIFVVMELRKQLGWSRTRVTLFHFRTQTGHEVDVVLETPDGRLAGMEIKGGASVDAGDFKGLRVLSDAAGESFACGVVLYTGTNTVALGTDSMPCPSRRCGMRDGR